MDSSRGHSARRYSELPEEIADIYERQEDFPELTAAECVKLKAFLQSVRLRVSFSEQQAAVRAGVEGESDRRIKRRERLRMILEFNELRRSSDVEIGRAMPAKRVDESKSGSKGRRWSKNLDPKAKAYQASDGKDAPPHPASPECVKEQTSHSDEWRELKRFIRSGAKAGDRHRLCFADSQIGCQSPFSLIFSVSKAH